MAGTQKYTAQQIIDTLKQTKGMIYIAAERLGCSAQTIKNYGARYISVREAMEQEDEQVNDVAELKLIQAIHEGEAWAVKYRLSTKGRSRGYIERQEVAGVPGQPLFDVDKLIDRVYGKSDSGSKTE